MRNQKTININGHKIKVITNKRTCVGNFIGYSATVTDDDYAYSKFVQKFC